MREFQICKKCLKRCDFKPKKFREKLANCLGEDGLVELTSCLKICPKRGVCFLVRVSESGERASKVKSFVAPEESTKQTVEKILTAAGA